MGGRRCVSSPVVKLGTVSNQDLRLAPGWVLVLLNALEIGILLCRWSYTFGTIVQKMAQSRLIFPQNGALHGTMMWKTPYSTPICNRLTTQSLWKRNNPYWRRLLDPPTIVLTFQDDYPLIFQDDYPENGSKTANFHLKMDHGVAHALLNTHLQSFDSPMAMEEEWPTLEMPI